MALQWDSSGSVKFQTMMRRGTLIGLWPSSAICALLRYSPGVASAGAWIVSQIGWARFGSSVKGL